MKPARLFSRLCYLAITAITLLLGAAEISAQETWLPNGPGGDGRTFNTAWFASATTGWVVGADGLIYRTTNGGTSWIGQTSNTTSVLSAIWGSDANNVWAVGSSGAIRKWDGSTWSAQDGNTGQQFFGIWGVNASNAWTVGGAGSIRKWNGSAWVAQASGTTNALRSVWGSDTNNVWAVGDGGVILKWDGSVWSTQTSGTTQALLSVWGSDASNIWAMGRSGTILKWNGSAWSAQTSGIALDILGAWGSDANNVWAVAAKGTILKWNGSAWNAQSSGTVQQLNGVGGSDANNVWAMGIKGTIVKWNGSTWNMQLSGITQLALFSVWGSDASNVWAVGEIGTILKWNGSVWSAQSSGTTELCRGVWGSDASNVWAVGTSGTIVKWNGSAWSAQTSGAGVNLNGVWGSDASNIWAVGGSGTIVKWNGSAWGGQTSGTTNALRSVWGSDASNVWAVGDNGTILKWNGSTWSTQISGPGANLNGVWGSDANNVWAVGDSGTILKWNGSTWSAQTSGTGVILFSVWGSDASNVWAVGNGGKILKWNGSAWSASTSNTATTRRFLWGTSATQVIAVGDSGLIQTNASFSVAPTVTSSTANLNGNATTLAITGTGFDTTPGNNTVVFNNGAVGTVTAATATQLTVTFTTQPTSFGGLTVIVTNGNGSSGAAVQVANVANIVATLTGGDLVITDVANGGDTLSLSESASHLVVTADASSVINSNAGTGSGSNTVSIPLASITGSITVNAAGGADSINIGAFATPLPSLTLNGEAGNDVVNFNAEVTAASGAATAETILVAGVVRSTSGGLSLTASAGVTVNGTADGGPGTLAINSDVDADGAGSLVVGASGALYGVAITVQAADVDIASTATVGNTSKDPVVTTFVDDTHGLNYPVGMEFDAAGNLFVVNNGNNTVSKVTPGGVVTTFVSSATLLGAGMQSAEGLAIDAAGDLFITNSSNNTGSVARVTAAGVASSFATGIEANHGLTFDSAGDLYVVSGNTNPATQIMSKVSPLGVVSTFVPSSNLSYPTDVTLSTSGDFYVLSWGGGVIHRVTPAGVVSSFASVGGRPWKLDFDSSGNLFYVEQDGNFVNKVTPAGVVSTYITSTAISGASGIVVDAAGNLLIGRSNNTIVKVAPSNAVTNAITIKPSMAGQPISLGLAMPASLHLTDAELDRLTGDSLIIGGLSAGHVTLSAAIHLADNMNTQIITAGDITFDTQGSLDTNGGTLLLQSGSSPQATRAQSTNNEIIASQVSFGNGLAFLINGTSSNVSYDQLSVAGAVDLSGRSLTLSGTHVPVAGESFILINNDSNDAIMGTFSGIAEGGTVSFNGRKMTVSYVGGTGNDVELKAAVLPDLVSFVASPYKLNRNTGLLEQLLRVTNKSSETLQGYRVTLTNMPSYYTFWNKTHPVLPYADVYQSIAPGATVDFYAHIYSGTRTLPGWVATYTVEGISDVTLNPTSKSMPPTDGSYLMDVNTLGVWNVSESLPWATVSPTSGKGPGLVTVTLLPNTTLSARSGNIQVGNATHILTQTGVLQPVLGALAPFDCMVSQSVSLTIPTSNRPTTAYLATGLPKGLTIDHATGLLHGRPTVPGAYNVSIRARNAAGYSNTITTVITVHALPQDFVGNYHGYVERSVSVYVGGVPNLGSRFEMLISATGDVTGKLIEGSVVKPFTGILSTDYATPNAASMTVPIASNTLSLKLSTAGVRGSLISSASSATAEMVAWRNVWSTANPPAAFGALHHFVLQTKPVAGTPEGHSTGAFTVNAITGALTVKGKLADGSAFVTSTFIGQDGQVLIYQPLYANRGSVIGQVDVAANAAPVMDNTVTGSVSWMKPAVAKDLAYPLGFGPLAFIAAGGTYVPPAPGQLVMGLKAVLPPLNNSTFSFTLGGLDLLGQQFNQNARVVNPSASGVSNLLLLPRFNASLTPNPNGNRVTSTVDAQSGIFSGSFTVPGTTAATNRLGSFSGLIVPTRGGTQGYGCFLLPYVPTPPQTVNTAPRLSGAVSFTASF